MSMVVYYIVFAMGNESNCQQIDPDIVLLFIAMHGFDHQEVRLTR